MDNKELMEQLRNSQLTTKAGIPLAEWLTDMDTRADAVLIYHQADSRKEYDLTQYILAHRAADAAEGLERLKSLSGAAEVITCQGSDKASPALREPTALYTFLDEGVARSDLEKHTYLADHLSYGYHGRPTLVVTAEDCCMVSDVANGRPVRKTIACIDGEDTRYMEAEVGTPLADITAGFSKEWKALLLGDQTGALVVPGEDMTVQFSYLFDTVQPIYADRCVVSEMAKLAALNAADSCQKCVICREGTWQTDRILQDVITGKGKETDLAELKDMARIVSAGSMCQFGQNALQPLKKALELFAGDFEEHIRKHTCAHGICCSSKSYQIDPHLCSGCTDCVDVCEYDAIDGKKGFIHTVDEKMCEQCGACVDECPEGAIKFGANLKVPTRPTKVGRFRE